MLTVRYKLEDIKGLTFVLMSPCYSNNYSLLAVVDPANQEHVRAILKSELTKFADALDATDEIRVVSIIKDSGKFCGNTEAAIVMTRCHCGSVADLVYACLDTMQDYFGTSVSMRSESYVEYDAIREDIQVPER